MSRVKEAAVLSLSRYRMKGEETPRYKDIWYDRLGVRALVDSWFIDYEGQVEEAVLGTAEAVSHRRELYLGDEFHPQHGEAFGATYKILPIKTTDSTVTLGQLVPRIIETINPVLEQTEITQTLVNSLQESQTGSATLSIGDQWNVIVSVEKRDDSFEDVVLYLEPQGDEELDAILKERDRLKKEVSLLEGLHPEAIENAIHHEQSYDYQTRRLAFYYVEEEIGGLDNIIRVILSTGNWNQVTSEEELAKLAEEYWLDAQRVRAVFRNSDENINYLLSVECIDDQADEYLVTAYLTNSDVANKRDEFIMSMELPVDTEIERRMGVLNEDGECDFSPRDVVMRVLREQDVLNRERSEDWTNRTVLDLLPTTAIRISKRTPLAIATVLAQWSGVVQADIGRGMTILSLGEIKVEDGKQYGWFLEPDPYGVNLRLSASIV